MFIDRNYTLYVAHLNAGTILIWSRGSLFVPTVISLNTFSAVSLFVTDDNRLFISYIQTDIIAGQWSLNNQSLTSSVVVESTSSFNH